MRLAVLAVLLSSTAAFASDEPPPYPPAPPPPYPAPLPAPAPSPAPAPAPIVAPAPAPVQYQVIAEGPKSAMTAGLLSLGATVAPPLLMAIAYSGAHEGEREDAIAKATLASVMIGPSVGQVYAGKFLTPGLVVRAVGFAIAMSAANSHDFDDAIGRVMLGGIGILSGAVYDIASTGKSVREYNAEHVRTVPMVSPIVDPSGGRGVQVGMTGAF